MCVFVEEVVDDIGVDVVAPGLAGLDVGVFVDLVEDVLNVLDVTGVSLENDSIIYLESFILSIKLFNLLISFFKLFFKMSFIAGETVLFISFLISRMVICAFANELSGNLLIEDPKLDITLFKFVISSFKFFSNLFVTIIESFCFISCLISLIFR